SRPSCWHWTIRIRKSVFVLRPHSSASAFQPGSSAGSKAGTGDRTRSEFSPSLRWPVPKSCSPSTSTTLLPTSEVQSSTPLIAQRRDLGDELIECAQQDPDPAVRASALEALHALGIRESVPAALDCLSDADPKVRAQAMSLLGDLGGQDLADVIGPRSSDPQPLVRAAAARALGLVRARDATQEFTRLLRDPEPLVRAAAADGVAAANARVAAPVLTDLLGDNDPEVRLAVARALGALGDAGAVKPMLRTFRDADPALRLILIQSIARLDPAALEELIDFLLEARDEPSRVGVVETIGHL